MKIYYDTTNSGTYPQAPTAPSWTEITAIKSYPKITTRMDETSHYTFSLNDSEGALYSTWQPRNFTRMEVRDDSANVIHRGYLTKKTFEHNKVMLSVSGISKTLQWIPIHENYILAEGYVNEVPSEEIFADLTEVLTPNADGGTTDWQIGGGAATHHEAVADYSDSYLIAAGDGAENNVDIIGFTTNTLHTVTDCTKVVISLYGMNVDNAAKDPTVDLDAGDGYIGAKACNFGTSYGWATVTFDGLANIDQTDIDSLLVKVIANADYTDPEATYIKGIYVTLTFDGNNGNALGLVQGDDDRTDFAWADDDYWITEKDTGILIRDNTTGNLTKVYTCTALNDNGTASAEVGDHTGLATNGDGTTYVCTEVNQDTWNCQVELTVEGDNIANTNTIQRIDIDYNFVGTLTNYVGGHIKLQWSKDGSWKDVANINLSSWGIGTVQSRQHGRKTFYNTEGTEDLTDYLVLDGDQYDAILGMRFKFIGDYITGNGTIQLTADYLAVTITYNSNDITPIMEQIDGSATSCVVVDSIDWDGSGVSDGGASDGDIFRIGENTIKILNDVSNECGIPFNILSTGSKYIAQQFKGTHGIDILRKVCLLEGWHWREEYTAEPFGAIVISHLDDCVDSAVDLTQADYGYDWKYDDDTDFFSKVIVYGAAAYNVNFTAYDDSINSPKTKIVFEETINTHGEAKEVAETQLAEWKVKHPSIKLSLNGVNTAIKVGTEITLTMARPEVLEANYPIRMIEREKFGGGIKTTIYAGMGHSKLEEKLADRVNKIMYLAKKAHTDRLVSTPLGEGVSGLTWGDISGAEAAVDAIIAGTNHTVLANPNGEADEQHLTAAQVAALHSDVITTTANVISAIDGTSIAPSDISNDDGSFSISSDGTISYKPSGDNDDYLTMSTAANQAYLNAVGSNLNLQAPAGGFVNLINNGVTKLSTTATGTTTVGTALNDGVSISSGNTLAFVDGGSADIIRDEDDMVSNDAAALATQQSIKAYIDAEILATQDTVPLYAQRLANGCLWNSTGCTSLVQYPAADSSCSAEFNGVVPTGWTAMTNPVLHVFYLSTANDAWATTIKVNSATVGEVGSGNNLYNAVGAWSTVGAAFLWHEEEISLTGTLSPNDAVGVRIYKTSVDTQILYLHAVAWITRT